MISERARGREEEGDAKTEGEEKKKTEGGKERWGRGKEWFPECSLG
jgi:hypothetical protein